MADSFSLSIANLGVKVHCSPAAPVMKLREMYCDFPLNGEADLTLEIAISGEARISPLLDTGMYFKEGALHFNAPGYQGYISEQDRTGRLHLSSRYPVEEIDYYLRVAFALLAFQAGGMMLHAAGIVRERRAYLFCGNSGAGKTTVSSLSADGSVLNDDLVILLPEGDGWRVFGTPFWNPTQVKPNALNSPLTGLFVLKQAHYVSLKPLDESKALAELVANVPVITQDPSRSGELFHRLNQITQTTAVKDLYFKPDASFWDAIAETEEK